MKNKFRICGLCGDKGRNFYVSLPNGSSDFISLNAGLFMFIYLIFYWFIGSLSCPRMIKPTINQDLLCVLNISFKKSRRSNLYFVVLIYVCMKGEFVQFSFSFLESKLNRENLCLLQQADSHVFVWRKRIDFVDFLLILSIYKEFEWSRSFCRKNNILLTDRKPPFCQCLLRESFSHIFYR